MMTLEPARMLTAGKEPSVRHYFVDEAGDGTLFDSRGRVIVGSEGCSRFFILGLVDIPAPGAVSSAFEALRTQLLADPYFKNVPSMQPAQRKTALAFHAKDDVPEVRREVFAVLGRFPLRFFAVVRDKQELVAYVRQRNEREPGYRYNPNELYDYLVRRLCINLLHKDDEYHIVFAQRGASDRTNALKAALEATRRRFSERWNKISHAPIHVTAATPAESAGLQISDYLLWALQRLYERREDRYVDLLWPAFRLVHDLDDTRQAQYGVYYTQKKPLSLAALHPPGI